MNRFWTLRRREALTGIVYTAIPLSGFFAFYVVPFGVTIQKTFSTGVGEFNFVGFSNYLSVLRSSAFRLAVGNTFKFIAIGVPLLMILSLVMAMLINTRVKGADAFRTAYALPLVIPTASVILVFQIIFDNGGVINYTLNMLGFSTVNILRSSNVFWILLLLYLWKNMGYSIILMLVGLTQIPKEYYEAAKVDGAGRLTQLRRITLPLMEQTFFFVMIISIIGAFKSFREAFALGGAYPHDSIYMLQHFMNNNFAKLNYPRLSVAALLTFFVIFVFVIIIFMRYGKGGKW